MIKFLITLFVIVFAQNAQAQTPPPKNGTNTQLLLNMQIPCSNKAVRYISDLVDEYGEQEFASGVIAIKPLSKSALDTVDLLMYVNPRTRTMTLFTLQQVGDYEVACVLAGGTDFTPFTGEYREEKK